ncbi:XRE family transcriptional regulator [Flagellimonas lutimaris]|uniref:XRE family transcriptional regulator n=1 Tax=Flagellimonas lutimaris TaxID=475082 RepID=A0A3A1NA09_9FLAO|nr:helix-turn-helix transcriptional regulator [Allomuricauda lutimaris]RIV36090.1 XRE family transcriptional regulator [Allomuricauda lutimaris]
MNAKQHIGHIIQERRTQMRITQEQLVEMAQVGINTLYKIEKGDANPTLSSLEKIADVLGLEMTLRVKEIPGIGNETGKDLL